MAADLRDEGSLQQQVWPTCLNLALMSEDDADEELSDPNQPVVVLRDRLITDATVADLLPACKSMTNKGSPLLGSSSTRPLMMSSANQHLATATLRQHAERRCHSPCKNNIKCRVLAT